MSTGLRGLCRLYCLGSWLQLCYATGTYEAFLEKHGRSTEASDSVSLEHRRQLFEHRRAEVMAHNTLNKSWTMAVNKFADYTQNELQAMLGYKRVGGRWSQQSKAPPGASSLLQSEAAEYEDDVNTEHLAMQVDYRESLPASAAWVRNQGNCGSCWAVSAVGALEMHAERWSGLTRRLSTDYLVDCVPNPSHCGGTGGCKGATGELAFDFARSNGLVWEGTHRSSTCKPSHSALKVDNFVRLPENKASHLMHAVATKGPVVVSIDGNGLFNYEGGVYSGCARDTVVNHAVLAIGYGHEPASRKDYWLVRNSWGQDWGENGFVRIERHMSEADPYCGIDDNPKAGVYCDDAPPQITVCGMCGITSDSSYPILHLSHNVRHRVAHAGRVLLNPRGNVFWR